MGGRTGLEGEAGEAMRLRIDFGMLQKQTEVDSKMSRT